jgi:hypothetical protein
MKWYVGTNSFGEELFVCVSDGNLKSCLSDPDNSDYQQYLEWLAEGNTPEPWQPEENK